MPRKPRELEVGRMYHIVNRGVEKRNIFLRSQDYSRFILGLEFFNNESSSHLWDILARGQAGTAPTLAQRIETMRQKPRKRIVDLLAFALMPNHYHLIVHEVTEGGISLFMRKLGGYSMYFNKQYNRVGPLFQSRYRGVPVQSDEQLAVVFAYVHTNPIELTEPKWKERKVKDRLGALEKLEEYRWSSYRDYTGIATFPQVTQREFFTNFYGSKEKCRQAIKDWIAYKAMGAQFGSEIIE
ncbi:MAG: transposase [bacterium]|nr:transposase [bacterium]